jgi:TRAP-type C4-dicarboxylate transport system substrate-binding protein
MTNKINNKASPETIDEAMQVARATQRPGQSKEETKLIAQGIEKGITLYKKQQKEKARAANKVKKQSLKNKGMQINTLSTEHARDRVQTQNNYLPWIFLVISWMIFVGYIILV